MQATRGCSNSSGDGGNGCTRHLEILLEKLYAVHNIHFAELAHRAELERDIDAIIAELPADAEDQTPRVHARILYVHGKALNALPEFSEQGYECLARSLKLDPSCAAAWTAMGCCLVKCDEFSRAGKCFERALAEEPNKEALQMLSMVMRKLPGNAEDRVNAVVDALNKAQDAVKLDLRDAYSWYLLGNGLLIHFFEVSHDPDDLKKVQRAYQQAVKHLHHQNPDLFFNQGTVLKYLEQYTQSLASFQRAGLEDPTLPVDKEIREIVHFVSRAVESIESRAGLKVKKFNAEIDKLAQNVAGKAGEALTPLRALAVGANEDAVLICKILACFSVGDDPVPVSFIVADHEGTLMALSIYHVNAEVYSMMKVFEVVMISHPVLRDVKVEWDTKLFQYKCICIENPSDIVVKGKRLVPRETKLVVRK